MSTLQVERLRKKVELLLKENNMLRNEISGRKVSELPIEKVIDAVCSVMRLTRAEVLSPIRKSEYAIARFIISNIGARKLHMDSASIGRHINRDGSSVRHGTYEIDNRLALNMNPETRIYKEVLDVLFKERQADIEHDRRSSV
jgi:chromosomal replication initiation ATPase DnaA